MGWDNYEPQLAWSGAELGLVWYARDAPAPYSAYFARLDADVLRLESLDAWLESNRPAV